MCMEDIRLGRALAAAPRTVTLTAATAKQIAGNDVSRTRLVVAADGTNVVFVAPLGVTPANGVGLALTASVPFAVFTVEEYGKLVQGPWSAFCQAAGPTLTIIEASLEKQ